MSMSYQLVRVFHKANEAWGNQAAIFYEHMPDDDVSLELNNKYNITTQCVVLPLQNQSYNVRCFNAQHEVQCCGHGMIAAAKTLFSENKQSEIIINKNILASHYSGDDNETVSLSLPRLSAQVSEVPSWVDDMLLFNDNKKLANKAAISDEKDGYLLLEFDETLAVADFRSLQIDFEVICKNTNRAVVLIRFEKNKQHLYTRYFAPQYGIEEDSATGSVMRFVGDYIDKNYQCSRFEVSQCSTQGGYMKIECEAEKIVIIANAKIGSVE